MVNKDEQIFLQGRKSNHGTEQAKMYKKIGSMQQ
jgi:hypothetical protein